MGISASTKWRMVAITSVETDAAQFT
jgi:hypothetical protein